MSSPREQLKERRPRLAGEIAVVAEALATLERLVAAVRRQGQRESKFTWTLSVLTTLSRKEGFPLAIIGDLGAIHHGYERFTKDINVVVPKRQLDVIVRVVPKYGIKVVWHDPHGWHKLQYEGVAIDIVPEGGKPREDAPTTIPGPRALGVPEGTNYASLAGWIETKLGSNRIQDRADVVQVMKATAATVLGKVRKSISKVHSLYLQRFDDLLAEATEEKKQEKERGGPR